MAYSEKSDFYIYPVDVESPSGSGQVKKESEPEVYMSKEDASKICTIVEGKDQSHDYDLENMPIITHQAYMCCDECDKNEGLA